MKLGDAFLMPVGKDDKPHLFFVISDTTKHPVVIVNLTTKVRRAGKECVMRPRVGAIREDHPCLTEESYVSFTDAYEVSPEEVKHITMCIQKGLYSRQPSLRPDVLERVLQAARASTAIAIELKAYLPKAQP